MQALLKTMELYKSNAEVRNFLFFFFFEVRNFQPQYLRRMSSTKKKIQEKELQLSEQLTEKLHSEYPSSLGHSFANSKIV